jgi:hypothetical protein
VVAAHGAMRWSRASAAAESGKSGQVRGRADRGGGRGSSPATATRLSATISRYGRPAGASEPIRHVSSDGGMLDTSEVTGSCSKRTSYPVLQSEIMASGSANSIEKYRWMRPLGVVRAS